jgi:hypothetical protein
MAEIEQKLVLISQLRAKLKVQRQQEAAELGLGNRIDVGKPAADVTGQAETAAPMSAMDTYDPENPPGIGEYNPEENAREAVGDVSRAVAFKPGEIAPAASTAVRYSEPSQVDVPPELTPGKGLGIGRTIESSVDAIAGGLAESMTLGMLELPDRARKAMEEHPILSTAAGFAGQALPVGGAVKAANLTIAGVKAAIPSLLKSEGGKELVDIILRKAGEGAVAGTWFSAMREGVAAAKGEERTLNDVLVGLATDVGMFVGGEALVGGIRGAKAAKV